MEAQIFHFQEWLHTAQMDADKSAPEKAKNVSELEIQLCNVSELVSLVIDKLNLKPHLFYFLEIFIICMSYFTYK